MSPLPLSIFVRTGGEGLVWDIFSAVVPQIQVSFTWCCLGSNSSSTPSWSFLLFITVGCNHVHTKSATAITLTVKRNLCRVPTIHPHFKSGEWKGDGTKNVFVGDNIFKQKMFLSYPGTNRVVAAILTGLWEAVFGFCRSKAVQDNGGHCQSLAGFVGCLAGLFVKLYPKPV